MNKIIKRFSLSISTIIFTIFIYSSASYAFNSKIYPIDNNLKNDMLKHGTYTSKCPVPPNRLKKIVFSYYDFEKNIHHDGTLIVMDAVAEHVINIFKELYEKQFPIHKINRIELYGGDDELSLEDNNTSCFNCRSIVGDTTLPSIHSYGLAIDINPWQNPYVTNDKTSDKKALILPSKGLSYLNRKNLRPGMAEQIVHIFEKNGFTVWGGSWNSPIDWQHFQTSRTVANLMAIMSYNDAKTFFKLYAKNPTLFNKVPHEQKDFIDLYKSSRMIFMKILKNKFDVLNQLEPNDAIFFLKKQIKKYKQ